LTIKGHLWKKKKTGGLKPRPAKKEILKGKKLFSEYERWGGKRMNRMGKSQLAETKKKGGLQMGGEGSWLWNKNPITHSKKTI